MSVMNKVAASFLRGGQRRSQRGLFHGVEVGFGNTISFSHIKTRRKFRPNIRRKHLYSEILDRNIHVNMSTKAIRTMDLAGGLDRYILNNPPEKLKSERGERLRLLMLNRLNLLADVMDEYLISPSHMATASNYSYALKPYHWRRLFSKDAKWKRDLSFFRVPSPLVADPPLDHNKALVPISQLTLVPKPLPLFLSNKFFAHDNPELQAQLEAQTFHDSGHSSLDKPKPPQVKNLQARRARAVRPNKKDINLTNDNAINTVFDRNELSPKERLTQEYNHQLKAYNKFIARSPVVCKIGDQEFKGKEIVRSGYLMKLKGGQVQQILTPSLARLVEVQRVIQRRPLLSTLWWNSTMNNSAITFDLTEKGLALVKDKLEEASKVFEKQQHYLRAVADHQTLTSLAEARRVPLLVSEVEKTWKENCALYLKSSESSQTWVPPTEIMTAEQLDIQMEFYTKTFPDMQNRDDLMNTDPIYRAIAKAKEKGM